MRRPALVGALASSLVACSAAAPSATRITEVLPPAVLGGAPMPVEIRGAFPLRVRLDLDRPEESELRGAYGLSLSSQAGTFPLGDVHWRDPGTLTAQTPPEAPSGRYDLVLVDPWGRTVRAEGALLLATECVDAAACDDALACTDDACVEGVCRRPLSAGHCLIGGVCHPRGAQRRPGGCSVCAPEVATDRWVARTDGSPCDDQSACSAGDTCTGGECRGDGVCGDTAPTACLEASAAWTMVGGSVTVDPGCSSDLESADAALEVRLDTDADGTFDTAFAPLAPHAITFPAAGVYRVSAEVRDPGGNVAAAGRTITVTRPEATLVVTTAEDEADVGATADVPLGSGLSLREAILLANAAPPEAPRTIVFAEPLLHRLAPLPALTAAGARIVGGPGMVLLFPPVSGAGPCLSLGDGQLVAALALVGCAEVQLELAGQASAVVDSALSNGGAAGARLSGIANTLGPGVEVSGCADSGVILRGRRNRALAVSTHHHAQAGVLIAAQAEDAEVIQVRSFDNEGSGLHLGAQVARARLHHNTLHGNGEHGLEVHLRAADVEVRGNLLTGNLGFGFCGQAASLSANAPNGFWGNGLGATCAGEVTPPSMEADPGYVAAAGDFRLRPGSPAIDASVDLGHDLNGASAGSWFNAAPDLGAVESPH